LEADDNTGAFMIVHTLKGNAAQIGKTLLSKAALDLEKEFRDDKYDINSPLISILETELNNVIDELSAYLEETTAPAETHDPLDNEAIIKLFEKLESLLEESDAEAMALVDELAAISGSETLIKQIEDFDFTPALESLLELKKKHT